MGKPRKGVDGTISGTGETRQAANQKKKKKEEGRRGKREETDRKHRPETRYFLIKGTVFLLSYYQWNPYLCL